MTIFRTPSTLRRDRLALGISLEAVARNYGCTHERIRQIERGFRLRAKTLKRYEAAVLAAARSFGKNIGKALK